MSNPRKVISQSVHTHRIILQSLLVSLPMLASSFVVIYIVYANLVNGQCPDHALCSNTSNETYSNQYLIDFPAARLAFVSSGSATVSFALLGVLMSMYAYVNAASLMRTSRSSVGRSLPTSDQVSNVLKLLNAEMMVLWDLMYTKVKRVFWHHEANDDITRSSPGLLRRCTMVLGMGIAAR